MKPAGDGCRFHVITPPRFDPVSFPDALGRALDGGTWLLSSFA